MSVNARALLTAYLQYQRDIGVDTIVFESGSAVKTLLADAGRVINKYGSGYSRTASTSAISTPSISTSKVATGGYGARPAAASDGGASDSPFSKLSKLRPVDALDMRKFERPAPPAPVNSAKREKLAVLYRQTLNCEACALSKGRAKVIFGSGSADGRVFVVGAAPGSCDEASGLPFQGEAGELFDKILAKTGLDRKRDIFATYAQKCRSRETQKDLPQAVENHSLNQQQSLFSSEPDNQGGGVRQAAASALELDNQDNGFEPRYAGACRTVLDRQIEIIEPKVILVFGRGPANFILENGGDIEQLRAMNHIYKGVPVVATYGLPLMLKETRYRSGAWDDIKKAMDYAGR